MTAMTPMKSAVLFGRYVLVEGTAEQVGLKAICLSNADAEWLAMSLAKFHNVELIKPEGGYFHGLTVLAQ